MCENLVDIGDILENEIGGEESDYVSEYDLKNDPNLRVN